MDFGLVKGASLLTIVRVGGPALSLLLVVVLTQKLGVEGMGRYALAYAACYLFVTIAPLGLFAIITRDGARSPKQLQGLLGNALSIVAVTATLLTPAMAYSGHILQYDEATQRAVHILSLILLPAALSQVLEAAAQALQRQGIVFAAYVTEYLVKVGVGVVALQQGAGLDVVLWIAVFSKMLACVVFAVRLNGTAARPRFALALPMVQHLLRLAPIFAATAVVAMLYWRIDIFMLGSLIGTSEAGLYNAAFRFFDVAMLIPASICLASYPQLAALAKQSDGFVQLGSNIGRILYVVTLPIAVGVLFVGDDLLLWLFGPAFAPAGATLSVLMVALVPYGILRLHTYLLTAKDAQAVDLSFNIGMVAVNVALNFMLIPPLGQLGAAIATLASLLLYVLVQLIYARHKRWQVKVLPPMPVLYSIAAMVVLLVVLTPLVHWLVCVPLAAALYVLVLVRTGFLDDYPELQKWLAKLVVKRNGE